MCKLIIESVIFDESTDLMNWLIHLQISSADLMVWLQLLIAHWRERSLKNDTKFHLLLIQSNCLAYTIYYIHRVNCMKINDQESKFLFVCFTEELQYISMMTEWFPVTIPTFLCYPHSGKASVYSRMCIFSISPLTDTSDISACTAPPIKSFPCHFIDQLTLRQG